MTEETEFKIIGSIGELNLSLGDLSSMKVDINCPADSEYELYLTFPESPRILYGKFAVDSFLPDRDNKLLDCDQNHCGFSVNISQWKTYYLPFSIKDFTLSNKSLWTLGKDFYVEISSQLEPLLEATEVDKEIKEDSMNIESGDEFHFENFETIVQMPPIQKYKPESEKFYVNCCLFDSSIIICSKDMQTMTWQLDLILSTKNLFFKGKNSQSICQLINFPLTYSQSFSREYLLSKVKNDCSKPIITFLQCNKSSESGYINKEQGNIFCKLLKHFSSSPSNCICLIGHPEGKLLYCLCSLNFNEQHLIVDTQLEILHDIKQPIAGIHFLKESHGIEGNGLLLVGTLGKVVYITADRLFNNSIDIKIKNESYFITTLCLMSNVKKCVIFKRLVIHTSDKDELWISEFSKQKKNSFNEEGDLKFSRNTLTSHRIVNITLLNELKGIFLFVSQYGDMYLSIHFEKEDHDISMVSLPSLMNEIMHQSSVLHNLNLVSRKQQDFFTAVSKFAFLKYNGAQEFNVTCSVIEINEQPGKFIININIKNTEKFDSKFWFVTASLYNFYQRDSVVVSKTLQYEADQTIMIEVQKSLLCSLHNSPFPLYVEVGLFLTLPESLMYEDYFKLITNQLPLYLKIKTLILNELYILRQSSQNCLERNAGHKIKPKNLLEGIFLRNLRTPIARVLHISPMNPISYPQEFTICLSPKKAQIELNDKTTESSLIDSVFKTIKTRNNIMNISELNFLLCSDQEVSLNMSDNADGTCITIHSKSFNLLSGLRMAMMELLLNIQNKPILSGSKCVSIPAIVNKECEKLSKDLLDMYGQNVERNDFLEKIVSTYCQLRNISTMLPFC